MLTNETLEERKRNLELFLLKILYHKNINQNIILKKFMDETIINFSEQCPVETGVFKYANDVRSTVTDNFYSAKSYISGWVGSKK